jgi:hypothetical protein
MICDLNFICVVIQASNTTDFKFESMERKKKLCHGQCIEIATMFFTFSLLCFFFGNGFLRISFPFYGGNDSVMCAPAAVT